MKQGVYFTKLNNYLSHQSTDDDVKLLVESFVVILDHAVVRDHAGTRNPMVNKFGSRLGLKTKSSNTFYTDMSVSPIPTLVLV